MFDLLIGLMQEAKRGYPVLHEEAEKLYKGAKTLQVRTSNILEAR